MMELFVISLAVIVILCIVLVRLFVVIVPARRRAIIERLGLFNRIIHPGLHVILWPFEYIKTVRGTYRGEDGNLKVLTQHFLPMDTTQLDIHPVQCLTKDRVKVNFDCTIFYNLTQPEIFAYEMEDTLNAFYHVAVQGIKHVLVGISSDDIRGQDLGLGTAIQDYINREMHSKGITAKSIRVQSVAVDDSITRANQEIAVKERQQAFLIQQEQATHVRNMAQLEQRRTMQVKEAELANEALAHKMHLQLLEAQAEAERKVIASKSHVDKERLLMEAGFTPDHIVQLKHVEAMHTLAQSENKVVYAPLEYWTSRKEGRLRQAE